MEGSFDGKCSSSDGHFYFLGEDSLLRSRKLYLEGDDVEGRKGLALLLAVETSCIAVLVRSDVFDPEGSVTTSTASFILALRF